MKRMVMIWAVALLTVACQQKNDKSSANETSLIESYLKIKDALVRTNGVEAQKAARALLSINENDELSAPLQSIANSSHVAIQRVAFETLSEKMYSIVKSKGTGITLYKQYCPMAFNDKGAYWLATEEEVNNPYFGNLMLHCGFVQEVITE